MAKNSQDKEAQDTLKVLDMLKAQKYPVRKKKPKEPVNEEEMFLAEEEELTNSQSPRPFAPPAP